jgi:adenosine deaminase
MMHSPSRPELERLVERIPKVELHIHIEGSLEPEMVFALANRNGVKLSHATVDGLRAAYRFSDLQSFLDLYYAGCDVLRTERDFYDMTSAYVARAIADRVVHAEVFFDPQSHTSRGVPFAVIVAGIRRALEEGRQRHGMSSGLILCFLRHLSEESALATLEEALPFRDELIGVGLDSGERGNPPSKFARVFARARAVGLHVVAHAGEEGPASYIGEALDILKAERIDHGVRCEDDAALVDRLVREQIPLTMCPLSNVKLRVFPALTDHNLKRLLDRGLAITINSDDPAYFGGYIGDNFRAICQALPLDAADVVKLAENAARAAFVPPETKVGLLREIRHCAQATDCA